MSMTENQKRARAISYLQKQVAGAKANLRAAFNNLPSGQEKDKTIHRYRYLAERHFLERRLRTLENDLIQIINIVDNLSKISKQITEEDHKK